MRSSILEPIIYVNQAFHSTSVQAWNNIIFTLKKENHMLKFLKWKDITEFLNNDYPENLLPTKKLPKRHKQIVQEKKNILRKIKKRIQNTENFLLKIENNHPDFTYPDTLMENSNYFLQKVDKPDILHLRSTQTISGNHVKILPNRTQNPLTINKEFSITRMDTKYNKKYFAKNSNNLHFLFSSDQLKNNILKKQIQYRAFSDFLMKLKEKKKISILYGNVSKKFFEKAYTQALRCRGKINENLLIQFETRLDVILYRICFSKNIYVAKQYITHNLVFVNGKILNIPSYQVKPGDIVSINLAKKNQLVNHLLEHLKTTLLKRRFRFLISSKYLQKYIKNNHVGQVPLNCKKITNKLKKRLIVLMKKYSLLRNSQVQKKHRFSEISGYKVSQKLVLSKMQNTSANHRKPISPKIQQRRLSNSKKFALLEGLSKINNLNESLTTFLKSKQNLILDYKFLKDRIYLTLKKSIQRKRSRKYILSAMRISSMKPLHLEVSYKLLTAIVLFSPQKISIPSILNMQFLTRSVNN